MKLSEKGRFAKPPKLRSAAAQLVSETIAGWDGIHARTHWYLGDENVVDGADFYLGTEEIGHIHLDAQAHVACSRSVATALVDAGLAAPFPWGREFVVFDIRTKADVPHALWLFELSCMRRRGATNAALLAEIGARAARRAG